MDTNKITDSRQNQSFGLRQTAFNWSLCSLGLSLVPWLYAFFAELMAPSIGMIVAPLAYLCLGGSIAAAITSIKGKERPSIRIAYLTLLLNGLYLLSVLTYFMCL